MKKVLTTFLIEGCLIFASSFLSCSSDSYPGLSYEEKDDVDASNSESSDRIPVLLFTKDPFYINVSNSTRSTGAYDQAEWVSDEWKTNKFYLYAFRSKAEDNPPLNYRPNYGANAFTDTENADCLIDGTLANSSYQCGMPVTVNLTDQGVEGLSVEKGGKKIPIYYSTAHQQTGFDFFMYRIDNDYDYNANMQRDATNGKIYYDLDLDGAVDPMYGESPQLTMEDVMHKLGYTQVDLSGQVLTEVRNILDYGYSTYSAHRGVHPTISLSHGLTRLKFSAYAGAANANNMTIDAIRVKSKHKARFTVASINRDDIGLDFSVSDDTKYLTLGTRDGQGKVVPLKDVKVKYDPNLDGGNKLDWMKQEECKLGESLLLPPSANYEMVIEFTEKRKYSSSDQTYDFKGSAKYTLTPPTDFIDGYFKEGYVFDIKVAIFGSEKIQVFADVKGWNNVDGGIEVEPDFEE